MCWGVGEVRGDVGKGEGSEVREEMWGSVLRPHTLTHFHTPPIPLPTSFLHTPTHFPTHPIHSPTLLLCTPHTSFLTCPHTPTHFPTPATTPPPYLFLQLPLPPPTPQHTSPFTPCTLPQLRLCGEVTMRRCYPYKFNWKSPIKFCTTTGNLKSCFGVGNVNFRCMKVWRSYHVVKLLRRSYHVAKLLATAETSCMLPVGA